MDVVLRLDEDLSFRDIERDLWKQDDLVNGENITVNGEKVQTIFFLTVEVSQTDTLYFFGTEPIDLKMLRCACVLR